MTLTVLDQEVELGMAQDQWDLVLLVEGGILVMAHLQGDDMVEVEVEEVVSLVWDLRKILLRHLNLITALVEVVPD